MSILKRYLEVEKVLKKVLSDLEIERIKLCSSESALTKEIVETIEPFKVKS